MKLGEHGRDSLNSFWESIESVAAGYQFARFRFVALKRGDGFQLSRGRLELHAAPPNAASKHFESKNVRAGVYDLKELGLTPRDFVDCLLMGALSTPHGKLDFPPENGSSHGVSFRPFHRDGIDSQQRQMRLLIQGENRLHSGQTELDWELKAASTPYEGVLELCNEFSVDPIDNGATFVEVTAFNVAAIAPDSLVSGDKGRLAIVLANGLDRMKASVGYRMFEGRLVTKRDQMRPLQNGETAGGR